MRSSHLWIIGAMLGLWIAAPGFARAEGGFPPGEAAKRMVLPAGFRAEVFASEPMIRQPVTASFDERGRLWVIEYLQYPVPAGLKPVTIDQYLRTEYDRVPEPPPKGPRGLDRIKILEDTDGDGKADKETIFVEGLNLASGLAVGRGGVFVGQAPYLLFYPDKNKDDKPDGDPEVLLTGFGLQDAHATVNSMGWGPDGWLYGAQGSTVTARIRGIEFQQGVWRYHPETKRFELFAEGGGNTWGLDWDATGNAFASSNGSYITFHVVQGGYYVKGFAKHGPLHNPRTYGYFGPIDYRSQKVGGHVTPGGVIYKGDAYPDAFRGKFIGGNLLSNAVYWHDLFNKGSTVEGRHGGVLIDSKDQWFRPIDITVGPDGCAYVVDWYDKRASHLDPRDNWDKTNGRIYRVAYGEPKRVAPFDLSKLSSRDLVALRTSKNDWQAAEARRILAERRDVTLIPYLKELLASDRDDVLACRDLWALNLSGGLDDATALELLNHPVPAVRRWVVRLLGDDRRMNASLAASLAHLAESDPDSQVRSQLASSCQRWGAKDALPILERLLTRVEDQNDTQIPLLLWWVCERHLTQEPALARQVMTEASFLDRPLVRPVILERLARLLASSGDVESDKACARLLAIASEKGDPSKVVAGMELGLEGRKLDAVPAQLREALERLAENSADPRARLRLAIRLGDPRATDQALKIIADAQAKEADRVSLVGLVAERALPETQRALLEVVKRDDRPSVRLASLMAMARFEGASVPEALIEEYSHWPANLRSKALDLLVGKREWCGRMIAAMASGKLAAKDLSLAQVMQIKQLNDRTLVDQIEKLWGRIPGPGSAEKVKRVAEIRGILPEGDKGSPARGVAVFQEQCAGCHKLFGQGESIGPELTGSERGNLDFLLTSLVDPSAFIRKEYEAQTLVLRDGRVLTGLILDENDKTLTLINAKREKTVVPVSEVEERKPSSVSLMPEGLLDGLKDEQVRDLFRYLQSSGPAR